MKRKTMMGCGRSTSERGFSLIELIVAIAVAGIIMAIAVPPFIEWQRNQVFRQTSRQISLMFREARNLTISRNIQHMVVVEPGNGRCRILRGSRANSTPAAGYATVVQQRFAPADVTIRSGAGGLGMANVSVQFNPNGTAVLNAPAGPANDGNVSVNDAAGPRFFITVTQTGRINMRRP